jgi:hypothetical protein
MANPPDQNYYYDRLPKSENDITAEWLQQALQPRFPEVKIEAVESEPIGEGYGLASQIFRFWWNSGRAPRSVIVKLWSSRQARGVREVHFYHTFGVTLRAWIPACFFAAADPEQEQGVLILEDPGRVTQGDCLLQLPHPAAIEAARSLAGIHAAWLDHKALFQADWLPLLSTWERGSDWFAPRRALFLERYQDRLDDKALALFDRIEDAQAAANQRLSCAPITLLHGDLHLDNYVFVDRIKPVLLDWAGCAKGPQALDLFDLLFSMCRERDREQVFGEYLSALTELSRKNWVPSEVWRQLGGAFLRKFAIATYGVANWNPANEREAAMIETGLKRMLSAQRYWEREDPELFSFLQ